MIKCSKFLSLLLLFSFLLLLVLLKLISFLLMLLNMNCHWFKKCSFKALDLFNELCNLYLFNTIYDCNNINKLCTSFSSGDEGQQKTIAKHNRINFVKIIILILYAQYGLCNLNRSKNHESPYHRDTKSQWFEILHLICPTLAEYKNKIHSTYLPKSLKFQVTEILSFDFSLKLLWPYCVCKLSKEWHYISKELFF